METKLRIRLYGDKILRKAAKRVDKIDSRVADLLDQMVTLMKVNKGIGLAANQAGLDLRMIVVDAGESVLKLTNPEIIKKEGKINFEEGCLSFPGISIKVNRAKKIWVSFLNDKGESFDLEADGVLSVVLQHEIDHINGVLFIDRVPLWERLKIFSELKKIKKTGKSKGRILLTDNVV